MSIYRVVVDDKETIYEGSNLVEALEIYGGCRQNLPRGDENVKVVQMGWNELHDRVIAEFIGRRQVPAATAWTRR